MDKQDFKYLLKKYVKQFYRTKSNRTAFNKLLKQFQVLERDCLQYNIVIIIEKKQKRIKVVYCKTEEEF